MKIACVCLFNKLISQYAETIARKQILHKMKLLVSKIKTRRLAQVR